jgi:hypothetical protein
VNTLHCLEEWRGKQRISPPGDNFTPTGQNSPLGTNSPQGSKFAPRGEVKNEPPNGAVAISVSNDEPGKKERNLVDVESAGAVQDQVRVVADLGGPLPFHTIRNVSTGANFVKQCWSDFLDKLLVKRMIFTMYIGHK